MRHPAAGPAGPGARRRSGTWLDGLIASACAAAFASLPFLGAISVDPAAPPVAVLVNLAYPVANVLLAGCLVGAWAVAGWRTERMWLLLSVGMMLFTIADALDVLELFGTDVGAVSSEPLFVIGLLAIAGAAWSTESTPKPQRVGRAWAAVSLPGVLACACLSLLLWGGWRRDVQLPHATTVLASVAIAAALLRMLLTVRSVESLADARREARTDDLTRTSTQASVSPSSRSTAPTGRRCCAAPTSRCTPQRPRTAASPSPSAVSTTNRLASD